MKPAEKQVRFMMAGSVSSIAARILTPVLSIMRGKLRGWLKLREKLNLAGDLSAPEPEVK